MSESSTPLPVPELPSESSSSSTMSTTQTQTASGPRQPKLRLACDACATSRVKCSKEHPRCGRCINGGHECVYGISRKHGRPQAKKKQQDSKDSSTAGKGQSDKQIRQQQFNGQRHFVGQGLTFDDSFPDFNNNIFQPWAQNMEVPSYFNPNKALVAPQDLMYGSPMPSRNDSWMMNRSMSLGNPDMSSTSTSRSSPALGNVLHRSQHSVSSLPTDFFDLDLHDSNSSNNFKGLQPTMDQNMRGTSNLQLQPWSSDSSSESHGSQNGHDCYALANLTLSMLHCEYPYQHQFDSSNGLSNRGTPQPQVPALDNILANNQSAIKNLLECLKCPCASDPHMAMLYASIISKVLRWYQIAAGVPLAFTTPAAEMMAFSNSPSMGDASLAGSWASNNMFTADSGVTHECVKVGNFSPDIEAQEPMRRVLLLGELQKAGQLIEVVAKMHTTSPAPIGVDGMDVNNGNLYATMGKWLREELSRTVASVRDQGSNITRS